MLNQLKKSVPELEEICRALRLDILAMIRAAGSGHPGGSLSSVEILTALYFGILNIDPQEPCQIDRDRFILSKGHIAPALYAVLAERGFFPREVLNSLRKLGSPMQGHPNMAHCAGLDCSSGSLGQGLSVASGLALAARLRGASYRTYCLMGDGELQEGQIWEAAMSAAHYGLDNLCGIVDYNGVQLDGTTKDIMNIDPVADKWRAFNWNVICCNGHDLSDLLSAFQAAAFCKGSPSVIIASCVKGKGVSFMEHQAAWHGQCPNDAQYLQAIAEVGQRRL